MTLSTLLAGFASVDPSLADLDITAVTADSRRCAPGTLFVALPRGDRAGFVHDGHDFAPAAVAAGATAVVATRPLPDLGTPVVVVEDTRWLLPRLAGRLVRDPSRQMRLVGITGTNGKTTSSYLLEAIWRHMGRPSAVVGTIETRLADRQREPGMTTPDPVTLQQLWADCLAYGVHEGVIEVSSHALHQYRVGATHFTAALFTNLTQDHLDYHPDLEDYFAAKCRLFAPDDWGQAPRAVINIDDPYGRRLLAQLGPEAISYGFGEGAVVRGVEPEYDAHGSHVRVVTPAGEWRQDLLVLGEYNISNALGVIGVALALELPLEAIRAGLAGCAGAPGRLEPVRCGQDFTVLVDYAHTPDAVHQATSALRGLTPGRVITVFGCGGDRDRGKRPQMGRIAAERSDIVVVTSDNPRTEDPDAIIAEIMAGIPAGLAEVHTEPDRAEAIRLAIDLAQAGDTVLILGKGHEDYQILGTEKHHFDDREVAHEHLGGRGL